MHRHVVAITSNEEWKATPHRRFNLSTMWKLKSYRMIMTKEPHHIIHNKNKKQQQINTVPKAIIQIVNKQLLGEMGERTTLNFD